MPYDPKRPRLAALPSDAAPVDALLASVGAHEPEPAPSSKTATKPAPATDQSNGLKPQQASEVPVAAAPEEGTANRAVLLAVAGASLAAAAGLIIWSLRRASSARD